MQDNRRIPIQEYLILALVCAIAYLPFLGNYQLFDWDEINFAESAREMIITGNYFQVQINFEPFWEKPPLFFWLQAASMHIFGVNEFAARLPNALCGIFTILLIYRYATEFRGKTFGRLASAFYFFTILPFVYFKSGIIDPVFNFFIFLGIIQVLKYEFAKESGTLSGSDKWRGLYAGLWIGVATLTKGPAALLITVLTYVAFLAIYRRFRIPWNAVGQFAIAWLAMVALWFGAETLYHGPWFLERFISYQVDLMTKDVATHGQPFWYHFVVFITGCFPMAAFAFRGMIRGADSNPDDLVRKLMVCWFWVVMIVFSAVKTKIVHYSSMLYFPGAFLAAHALERYIKGEVKLKWDQYVLWGIGILIFGIGTSLLNVATANLEEIIPLIKDKFAQANLGAEVNWTGMEFIPGFIFLCGSSFGLYFLLKKDLRKFLIIQSMATFIFINGLAWMVAPKIAQFTQGAAVDFYKAHAGEDVYITVTGFKSYAPFYYGEVSPETKVELGPNIDMIPDSLIRGDVSKDVYLVTKNIRVNEEFNQTFANFERLYDEAGFVFYKREAAKN